MSISSDFDPLTYIESNIPEDGINIINKKVTHSGLNAPMDALQGFHRNCVLVILRMEMTLF